MLSAASIIACVFSVLGIALIITSGFVPMWSMDADGVVKISMSAWKTCVHVEMVGQSDSSCESTTELFDDVSKLQRWILNGGSSSSSSGSDDGAATVCDASIHKIMTMIARYAGIGVGVMALFHAIASVTRHRISLVLIGSVLVFTCVGPAAMLWAIPNADFCSVDVSLLSIPSSSVGAAPYLAAAGAALLLVSSFVGCCCVKPQAAAMAYAPVYAPLNGGQDGGQQAVVYVHAPSPQATGGYPPAGGGYPGVYGAPTAGNPYYGSAANEQQPSGYPPQTNPYNNHYAGPGDGQQPATGYPMPRQEYQGCS